MVHLGEKVLADVTILFAREDRSRAEGIGAALAGSGFSVEAIPYESLSGTLESPAIVALWSRTMAASRAAISLGQSALAMGRLISARLDINVPAGLFRDHVMHDLIRWTGDPDDQVLDSLVADADQLVLAARSAPPAPSPVVRPVPPPPEPVRLQQVAGGGARPVAARPSPANDLAPAMSTDPALEEAAYWKAIRASTNREDFVKYLTRFGEEGLFAELALQKLAALPRPATEPPAPQQPVARFADSWRFGADWSTRGPAAAPTEEGPAQHEARAPVPRPPQAPAREIAPSAPVERRQQSSAPAPAARSAPPPKPAAAAAAKPAAKPYPPSMRIPANPLPEVPAPRRGPAGGGHGPFDRELADAPWDRRPSAPPEGLADDGADLDFSRPPPRALPKARKRGSGGFGAILGVLIALGMIGGGAFYWLTRNGQSPKPEDVAWAKPGDEAAPTRFDPAAQPDGPAAVALDTAGNLGRAAALPNSARGANPGLVGRAIPGAAPASVPRTAAAPAGNPAAVLPATASPAPAILPAPNEVSAATKPAPSGSELSTPSVDAVFSYGRPLEESSTGSPLAGVPAAAAPEISTSPAPQAAVPAGPKPSIVWARRPSSSAISAVYPPEANRRGIEGRAVLSCSVLASGELLCNVSSETPAGQGFGRAAIEAARRFRAAPALSNGAPAAGVRTSVAISFALD